MSAFSDDPWGCKNCGLCECHTLISLTDECPGFVKYPTGEHKPREIPVTLNFDMTKPIGTAKVFEDKHGIRVEMKIHDTGAQAILRGEDLRHLSINTAHLVRDKELEEIDRNARAYGYEIGRGHPLVNKIEAVSDDNPFMDTDWKERKLPWQQK